MNNLFISKINNKIEQLDYKQKTIVKNGKIDQKTFFYINLQQLVF